MIYNYYGLLILLLLIIKLSLEKEIIKFYAEQKNKLAM